MNIREIRKEKGMTQQQCADKAGVCQSTWAAREQGLHLDILENTADTLDMKPSELLARLR